MTVKLVALCTPPMPPPAQQCHVEYDVEKYFQIFVVFETQQKFHGKLLFFIYF